MQNHFVLGKSWGSWPVSQYSVILHMLGEPEGHVVLLS